MSARFSRPAPFPANPQRRQMIAKVHIAKAQLRMTDDDYRAVLLRVAGRLTPPDGDDSAPSSKDFTDAELVELVKEFERLGFVAKPKVAPGGTARAADHPGARKARALWISLHHLGAIQDASEKALEAFARRQLGCERLQWANQSLIYRLIEALKAIAERHGWSQSAEGVAQTAVPIVLKRRLVQAITDKLKASALIPDDWSVDRAARQLAGIEREGSILTFANIEQLDLIAKALGTKLRAAARKSLRAKGLA